MRVYARPQGNSYVRKVTITSDGESYVEYREIHPYIPQTTKTVQELLYSAVFHKDPIADWSKAALKMARIIRKENPTPVSMEDAKENLLEELADVVLCMDICDLKVNAQQFDRMYSTKLDRWKQRIREMKDGKKHNES